MVVVGFGLCLVGVLLLAHRPWFAGSVFVVAVVGFAGVQWSRLAGRRVGEGVGQVKQVEGIPRWFTYGLHVRGRRVCVRVGHDGEWTCQRCGLIQKRAGWR